MAEARIERRLAAILAADVAGYSRLMGADEVGTLIALKRRRCEVVDPAIAAHNGRIVKTTGDGMLVEFASAVDAVTCAVEVQEKMADQTAEGPRIQFRVGINIGDIIIDGDDIFGDGVNVAARVENECEPGGVCLSGSAFEQVRGKTDIAFDELGERLLKNIDRPVRLYSARLAASSGAASAHSPDYACKTLSLPDKPSIAVLPFQNMSGDPEQEYFADGIVEDIITALSRFKSLFVIARNSSFTYKGRPVDIKEIGRELGVRYVLEGSVRKTSGRVRVTGQLIDALNNTHLWADKFDSALEDVFDFQDKMTVAVVGSIAPKLEQAEIDRASRKATERLDSYDFFLRGMASHYRRSFPEARTLFKEAFARDPRYASAYAMAAVTHIAPHAFAGSCLTPDERAEAIWLAELAARLGAEDALALARSAQVLSFVGYDYDSAEALIERAVLLNPNLGVVWYCSGFVSLNCGKFARALESFKRVLRLSPLDPLQMHVWYGIALAHHGLELYEEGCAAANKAVQAWPEVHSLGAFIANAEPAGRREEAHQALQRILHIRPEFGLSNVPEIFPTRDLKWSNKLADAFRNTGLT